MSDKYTGMNDFLRKLRAPTMTQHNLPGGGDSQLADAAATIADEVNDAPYTPPFPVPIGRPEPIGDENRRGEASEVWLVNHPSSIPGTGVLVAGGAAEKGSQFPINSIRVDNITSQWMYWPENGVFVPPFWYGRVFRFTGSRVQRVRFETPTGITALAAATTEVARVVFSNEYWDEQPGGSVGGNFAPTTTGAPNLGVTIMDDLSGLPAEVQNPADALANQAGLVTVSLNEVWNGATWDRLRGATGDGLSTGVVTAGEMVFNGTNWDRARSPVAGVNAIGGAGIFDTLPFGFNGATFDAIRIPNIFKQINNVALGAGSTATVWTPASGKKPRLMGWVVDGVSGLVDAAITFFETSTTGTFMGDAGYIAGIQPPTPFSYGLGGPIVSTSSAVIVAFSSTAVTFRGTLFGTEE